MKTSALRTATNGSHPEVSHALRDTLRIGFPPPHNWQQTVILHSSRALTGCVSARRRARLNRPAYTINTHELSNRLHDRAWEKQYAISGIAIRRAWSPQKRRTSCQSSVGAHI